MPKCWYEQIGNRIILWEGICAVFDSSDAHLLKMYGDDIYQLEDVVNCEKFEITSEGYWECVEITGEIVSKHFYYHAENIENASRLLKFIQSTIGDITKITVRFDPDPLRLNDFTSMKKRIEDWTTFSTAISENCTIIFDQNMPL